MENQQIDCIDYNLYEVEPFTIDVFAVYEKFPEEIKNDECVICLSNQPNVLFCQCGHLCICKECKDKIETPRGRAICPLCRKYNYIINEI